MDAPDDYPTREFVIDEEIEDDPLETIRAKWIMDGASTLSEAAERVRAFAAELERLEAEGWTLAEPVSDDYGFICPPSSD